MGKGKFHALMTVVVLAALVVGGASLTGCSDSDNNSVPPELLATWLLQLFSPDDGSAIQVADPGNYTVRFQSDEQASIKADCNACGGRFFIDGDMLSFGTMACTLAACPEGSFGTQYQMALSTASGYELTPQLLLDYDGGVMRFIPAPTLF